MAWASTVTVSSGTHREQLCDAYGRLRINGDWTPSVQSDTAVDDSDKTFTVPASTEWEVQSIYVTYASTAAAGNRQLTVEFQDAATNVIGIVKAGIVQAASLTRYYLFAPEVTELVAFRDTSYLSTIMPRMYLSTSYSIRVWDSAAVAAAADDMVVRITLRTRSV